MHRPCRSTFRLLALLVASPPLLTLAACTPVPVSDDAAVEEEAPVEVGIDNLNAALWTQTAVEHRGSLLQAYELARRALDDALAESSWSAALEQTEGFEELPPAVILDVDETVLDNSYYEARLILDREVYSADSWDAWVMEQAATPVPGAAEFTDYAASKGVTVFYVTNRRAHLEDATRANLAAHGFPLAESVDTLLMRGEMPNWESSDKTPRRRVVASDYRILLMIGDNMGDFTSAAEGTVAERLAFAEAHREYWGKGWIALPNPSYGSWLGAILGNDYSRPFEQQVEIKKSALDPRR